MKTVASVGHGMSRRTMLGGGGAALVVTGLVGCSTDQDGDGGSGKDVSERKGLEAPTLAAMVEAGELPPVDERLPENPLVIEPTEKEGRYGGTLRGLLSEAQTNYIYTLAGYEHLVRWTLNWTGAPGAEEVTPNVAERFEVSEDGKVITFSLRPGMKWSDGEPFTANDILFAVEDVLLNEELYPVAPAIITRDTGTAGIEKVDDYSFRFVFPYPAGLFLQELATPQGRIFTEFPRHYLEEFHPRYNPNVDTVAAQEGFENWTQLFLARSGRWENPKLPRLHAWTITAAYGEEQQVVLERNPYYWKVDPSGSQLPYIDQVVFDTGITEEVAILKMTSGDVTLEVPPEARFTTGRNKPVLARYRKDGDYRFVDLVPTRMNIADIHLNLTHADPAKREVFQNKDFRIGLSHAINRDEIIQVVMQEQGEPHQAAPSPESIFYDEEFATQYLAYNVDLANEHLDRVLPEKDGDGIRLDPTGNPITVKLDIVTQWAPDWMDMAELIQRYWLEVGVDMRFEAIANELFQTRTRANEHDGTMWFGIGGLNAFVEVKDYLPVHNQSYYAGLWANYYLGRQPNETPPEGPARQLELYSQVRSTVDPEEQARLMTEVLDIAKDQFYLIGIARQTNLYTIAANNMRNLPEKINLGWNYATPGPTRPEQYAIDQ